MHAVACIYSPQDGFSSGEKFCTYALFISMTGTLLQIFVMTDNSTFPDLLIWLKWNQKLWILALNHCWGYLWDLLQQCWPIVYCMSVYTGAFKIWSVFQFFFYTKWSLMSPDHPGNIIPITVVQNITSLINSLKPLYILFFYHLS